MEQKIIAMCGRLAPNRILHYFVENMFFRYDNDKHPYTFFILGNQGPTGKTWLCTELRKHGFPAFELSESILSLVTYRDGRNHVIEDRIDRNIVIVLNEPLCKGE